MMVVRRPLRALAALAAPAGLLLAFWAGGDPNASLWHILGIGGVPPAALPRALTIAIGAGAATPAFGPPAAAVAAGSQVTFVNRLATPIMIRSTTSAPARFTAAVAAHAQVTVTLRHPGLYHYYDATTARPSPPPDNANTEYPAPPGYDAPSDVIISKGAGLPRQGWIAVLDHVPGLRQQLTIPAGHSVFAPRVLVAVAGGDITVANHDTLAHNFVVDSTSPTGAAFMIDGSRDVPTHGFQRALVLQQPGLYHVYCTLHTHVVGTMGAWHGVMANMQDGSWGGDDHDPMEAWIVVLPATVTI